MCWDLYIFISLSSQQPTFTSWENWILERWSHLPKVTSEPVTSRLIARSQVYKPELQYRTYDCRGPWPYYSSLVHHKTYCWIFGIELSVRAESNKCSSSSGLPVMIGGGSVGEMFHKGRWKKLTFIIGVLPSRDPGLLSYHRGSVVVSTLFFSLRKQKINKNPTT